MAERGGQPGNTNPAKGRDWANALRAAMTHRGDGDYRKILLEIADVVVSRARAGDPDSIDEIANRMDGKPHQSIGGDEGGAAIIIKLLAKDETA